MPDLIDQMKWRYACKKFTGEVIPEEKIARIIEAARLTPSSMGLQPYCLLLIEDKETISKLLPVAYNQSQLINCSHLIVLCAKSEVDSEYIDTYIKQVASDRDVSIESLEAYRQSILRTLSYKSGTDIPCWITNQVYLLLGAMIVACAVEEVDSCPMEGFNSFQLDEVLGLNKKGLKSIVLLPVGVRDVDNDPFCKVVKVRKLQSEFCIQKL